ncbi:hypothetical protein AGMMS49592_0370 [Endomicrobiia bacterium]|nr:hypothetical protein AGMMS49592_0370 [Endomicrobiia bacterium]
MAINYTPDQLQATIAYKTKGFTDQVALSSPLVKFLKSVEGGYRKVPGGTCIEERIRVGENKNFFWTRSTKDKLLVGADNLFLTARFDWGICKGGIQLNDMDKALNSEGSTRIFNLIDDQIRDMKMSASKFLNEAIFGGDLTNVENPAFDGLQKLIADDPRNGVVGGIDRAIVEVWRNKYRQVVVAGANPTPDQLYKNMSEMLDEINVGTEIYPSIILIAKDLYTIFRDTAAAKTSIVSMSPSTINLGSKDLTIQGIPVVPVYNCPSKHAYFLNSGGLRFNAVNNFDFSVKNEGRSALDTAEIWACQFIGNLSLTSARTQGVLYYTAP